ncbi:hypothetical protein HK104_009648 [Borealophlyctis nickersoniae]|nr:hypothetical protein HK104_009648 [Borealophlyctis nickersoniae]
MVDTTPKGIDILASPDQEPAAECPALTKTSDGKAIIPSQLTQPASDLAHLISAARDASKPAQDRIQAARCASDAHAKLSGGVGLRKVESEAAGTRSIGGSGLFGEMGTVGVKLPL